MSPSGFPASAGSTRRRLGSRSLLRGFPASAEIDPFIERKRSWRDSDGSPRARGIDPPW